MGLTIQQAQKIKQWARLCFWGCPKQGKTHAALAIASSMVGPGGRVGVISSEYGSSKLLSKKFPHDIIDLMVDEYGNHIANPFASARYEEALRLFVSNGYDAIVIDSLSHAWEGEGGILEKVNENKNTFSDGWGKVGTPMYQHLIKTILSTKAHIFITIRAKDGYVVEPNKEGKNVPRNVGLKPIIKSSFGYEMQLTIRMDALVGHIEESAFQDEFPQGTQIVRPGEDIACTLLQCLDGVPEPEPTEQQAEMRKLLDELYAIAPATYAKYANWEQMALRAALSIKDGPLPQDYGTEHLELMRAYVESKKKPEPRKAQAKEPQPQQNDNLIKYSNEGLRQATQRGKQRLMEAGLIRTDEEWMETLVRLGLTEFKNGKDIATLNAGIDGLIEEGMQQVAAKAS